MVPISIHPPRAEDEGCSATSTLVDSGSYSGEGYTTWWKLWRFAASAAEGWTFDHWEMSYSYQDTAVGGPSGNFTLTARDNPWSSGAYSKEGTEEWDDPSWQTYSGYQYGWRTITGLVAVFTGGTVGTGLILRSATSGAILHGAGGTILHDD